MEADIADWGSRGSVWIEERGGDGSAQATSSAVRLEPQFGNRRERNLVLPRPSSQPLSIFPPSRPRTTKRRIAAKTALPSIEYLRSKHPDFHDTPDEVLQDLLNNQSQTRPHPPDGAKVLATPYLDSSKVSLILAVGGPRDESIYISTLQSRQTIGSSKPSSKKRSKPPQHGEPLEEPTIRPSLLPAFVSNSPILDISLAPSQPAMPGSRQHEGPWISIRTVTGLHICAVHRVTSRQQDKASRPLPQFILSPIATCLTQDVHEQLASSGQDGYDDCSPGAIFCLDRYPVSDVAWDPLSRSTALIVDTQGNIWQWSVELQSTDNKWLTQGHRLERVSDSPLPLPAGAEEGGDEVSHGASNHRCRISWLDAYGSSSALLLTDHALWLISLSSSDDGDGAADGRIENVFEAGPSTLPLKRQRLHASLHLGLPQPLTKLVDHSDDAGLPLLVVASSTALHILDAVDPRRQLLAIPHHRNFDDDTLTLTLVPGLASSSGANSGEGHASILLSSSRDSTTTLYGIGCSLSFIDDSGQRRAVRAWQSHAPCEWPSSDSLHRQEPPVLALWKQALPSEDPMAARSAWREWRRGPQKDVVGRWAVLQRDADTGEVSLSGWGYRGPVMGSNQSRSEGQNGRASTATSTRERGPLPITVYQTAAQQELRSLIVAQEGRGVLIAGARPGQIEEAQQASWAGCAWSPDERKEVTVIDLSAIWARLVGMQQVAVADAGPGGGQTAQRQYDAITGMHQALGIVGESPQMGMVTGMDLFALASLHEASASGSSSSLTRALTPLWSGQGAISSVFAHNALLNLGKARVEAGVNADLIASLQACRGLGSGLYWDGERWPMASLLGLAAAKLLNGQEGESQQQEDSDDAEQEPQISQRLVNLILRRYTGNTTSQLAKRDLESSIWQIVHHLALANEVWLPRPVTVEALPLLPSATGDAVENEMGANGAVAIPEWDASTRTLPRASQQQQQQGLRSGPSQQSESLRSKMARMTASGDPMDVGERNAQDDHVLGDDEEEEEGELTIEEEARRRYPPPEPVHFAYFQPKQRSPPPPSTGTNATVPESSITSPPTTLASRLLLSTWPLTSLSPTAPENDPSYYTYSDPYVLLDAARRATEGGYGSSSGMSDASGWTTDDQGRARSRSASASASAAALSGFSSDAVVDGWSSVGGAGGWTSGAESVTTAVGGGAGTASRAWLSDEAARALIARRSVWGAAGAAAAAVGVSPQGHDVRTPQGSQRGGSSMMPPPQMTPSSQRFGAAASMPPSVASRPSDRGRRLAPPSIVSSSTSHTGTGTGTGTGMSSSQPTHRRRDDAFAPRSGGIGTGATRFAHRGGAPGFASQPLPQQQQQQQQNSQSLDTSTPSSPPTMAPASFAQSQPQQRGVAPSSTPSQWQAAAAASQPLPGSSGGDGHGGKKKKKKGSRPSGEDGAPSQRPAKRRMGGF